jgi:hypothetical protein
MRGALIRFMVVLSVLFAGLHEPVLAHDGGGITAESHRHDQAQSQDRSDPQQGSPGALGNEARYHHHCPVGLAGPPAEMAIAALQSCAAFSPVRDRPLASLATAPPLEPPLA